MLPASSLMPIIAARGLVRVYRLGGAPVPALRGVELTVGRGEFLAIMGRSGSGKSTLLNLLGCLDRPDAGRYWLDGVEVTALPPRQLPALRLHKLGFVFQQHNLLPTLTALENVALPLRYARCPGRERARRAQAALTAVGLADRVHHRPTELSGGQQQRVAIARALVNRPALLLADEPTGAVDSQTSTALIDLLRALNRQIGQTVVIVTHDETVAARTDRIIRIADGRIAGDERLN